MCRAECFVEACHQWVVHVQGKQRHELADFNNILQKVAEEENLLPLDDPAMDDWVPASVVSSYVSEVLNNCTRIVREMDMLDTIFHSNLDSRAHVPARGLQDSPEPEGWDQDDSTELRPPAELSKYSDMSPTAMQPPLSSSSSPEMQRQMSSSRVPPLRLGRASGPVPSLSAQSSARHSPAVMKCSPKTRLDLQHGVSSGRVPPLQLAQPAAVVPSLQLDGSGRKVGSQSAASSSRGQPHPHGGSPHGGSGHSSTAQSSAEQGPSSTEQAGSSGGRVPPLRLGTKGTGGLVPSLQLASGEQRTSTVEHHVEVQPRRESEAVSALRLSSPSGSEPDQVHGENMTQLLVPPLRIGRNSAVVPPLQLGTSKSAPQAVLQTIPAQPPVKSHPLTDRSEGSASNRVVAGKGGDGGGMVMVVKAADEMHGAQARQPRPAMAGRSADAQVAGSSRVIPDEPTPRQKLPSSSRASSRPVSARPPDQLSARRSSEGGFALREGLSARHVFEEEVSHRSSNIGFMGGSAQLQGHRASLESATRPGSSRASRTHTGQSSQGDAAEGLKQTHSVIAQVNSARGDGRPRSGKSAEWQSTTRDFSQPGTAPWRPVSRQGSGTGSEHAASRANSAQLSSQGREALMQGLVDGPRPGPARTDVSAPQRGPSPALASPVQSSLSSPSTSARQHPHRDSNAAAHLAKAVADGKVQVERPEPDGSSARLARVTLRGRPPEEASSSSLATSSSLPTTGGRSPGRSPRGRGRTGQPSGRTKANRTTSSLVQTWRGSRSSLERQGSGNSRQVEWQAGRGSPERSVVRRSLDHQHSLGQGSPNSPGQTTRVVKSGRAVKASPERSALAERNSGQRK